MKTIAALLTVHNRKEKTLQCLQHLFAQDPVAGFKFEVFIVDDGCTDGTADTVAERYPSVHIIKGNGELYWNRGMHKAWETAARYKDFDYYLWLNDDTLLNKDALSSLLATSKTCNDQSIVVGSTCAVNNPNELTYGGRIRGKGLVVPNGRHLPCDYFNGNIVLVPLSVYKAIGTNDPIFRHALGDFDYGFRAAKEGISSVVAPKVLGTCDLHESLPTWCNPQKTIKQRWKMFRTPLGQNPEEFFVFEKRHNGFGIACFHYLTSHLRVLFPKIWS